jgi:hypothetical protein
MLDEIRSFFEELREEPAPAWPEGIPAIDPATGATSEPNPNITGGS